jgi:hypothetical protein
MKGLRQNETLKKRFQTLQQKGFTIDDVCKYCLCYCCEFDHVSLCSDCYKEMGFGG